MRVVSWAVLLGLVVFVVVTDRSSFENLGILTAGVMTVLGLEATIFLGKKP